MLVRLRLLQLGALGDTVAQTTTVTTPFDSGHIFSVLGVGVGVGGCGWVWVDKQALTCACMRMKRKQTLAKTKEQNYVDTKMLYVRERRGGVGDGVEHGGDLLLRLHQQVLEIQQKSVLAILWRGGGGKGGGLGGWV